MCKVKKAPFGVSRGSAQGPTRVQYIQIYKKTETGRGQNFRKRSSLVEKIVEGVIRKCGWVVREESFFSKRAGGVDPVSTVLTKTQVVTYLAHLRVLDVGKGLIKIETRTGWGDFV